MKRKFIVLLLILSTVLNGVLAASVIQRRIPTTGTVVAVNVEVFWDAEHTMVVSSISWGMLHTGEEASATVYVWNSGNVPMTLSMVTGEWVPAPAEAGISVGWDAEGVVIPPDSTAEATITLSVSDSIVGVTDFQFVIIIEGTE